MRSLALALLILGIALGAAGALRSDPTLGAWGFGAGVGALLAWLVRGAREARAFEEAPAALAPDLGSDAGGDAPGSGGDG